MGRYRDRKDAGRQLGRALLQRKPANPIVLGLPRGGLPVAAEVAAALDAELDVLIVRKLGHPLQPELAVGAVASGGIQVVNPEFAADLRPAALEEIAARERREIERREKLFRGDRRALVLKDRNVILVDDGLATGATMLAAVRAARALATARVDVAVPVGDPDVCARLAREADEVTCLLRPASLVAVGNWYASFPQVNDGDVRAILDRARAPS